MNALPRRALPALQTVPARRTRLALFLALIAASTTACAQPAMRAPDDARFVRIDVVDRDSGQPLRQYPHRRSAWVAGDDGQPYTLRLQNLSGERVLVVLSVDGVNVVTGETAAPSQSGYVLAPYARAEIDGWRKSMHEVAAFRFSAAGESYAARTGRPFDLGVIGAAVFRERAVAKPWPRLSPPVARVERERANDAASAERRAQAAPAAEALVDAQPSLAGDARAPAPASPLGTSHGERRWSPTSQTSFDRAQARPDEVIGLRYDRYESLLARGVIREPSPRWMAREPRAFPAGFVPDP